MNPVHIYRSIQPFRVKDDTLMPWSYQKANQEGRPLHDDWGIISSNPILMALQPYQRIPRINCAYRVPLPFKITSGLHTKRWRLWQPDYPTVPGTPIEDRDVMTPVGVCKLPHALCDESLGGSVTFSVFLGGEWIECFNEYRATILGRKFYWYRGLKQDLTVDFFSDGRIKSDLMAWFPEVSISWKWVAYE